jgi:hypothetical protein
LKSGVRYTWITEIPSKRLAMRTPNHLERIVTPAYDVAMLNQREHFVNCACYTTKCYHCGKHVNLYFCQSCVREEDNVDGGSLLLAKRTTREESFLVKIK